MFEREAHQRVARVLDALDAQLLRECRAAFAGGTRLAMRLGEFRASRDLDVLVSDRDGYRELRLRARNGGARALFARTGILRLGREPRIDQYGIRFPIELDAATIKVEIIHEGRIDLADPVVESWTEVPCVSLEDAAAEKLLANSDRGLDRASLSRDLIDLAALRLELGALPDESWKKAEAAYSSGVRGDLATTATQFLQDDAHRADCFRRLDVRNVDQILLAVSQLHQEAAG